MTEWTRGDPAKAPTRAPLAFGGPLDEVALLAAYRSGIFPWYSEGEPVAWWCPDPRFVLRPEDLRVTDSLRRTLRKPGWTVTFDQDFAGVMRACAAAQARITPAKSWSKVTVQPGLRKVRRRLSVTRKSSGRRTKRGSGHHQATGSPSEYQGKIPER